MRVLVTRPLAEAESWVQRLRERGFDAVPLPLIEIHPAPDAAALAQAWQGIDTCRAVMFVSANAVRGFFAHRPAAVAWPQATRAWSVGAGTRRALVAAAVPESQIDTPAADSPSFDSEALWAGVASQVRPGDRVLIVRGGEQDSGQPAGRDWLATQLRACGAQVDFAVAYVRGSPSFTDLQRETALAASREGAWIFSSSQAIAHLREWLPQQDWSEARAVATHPRIAHAARDASFGVVCESRPALEDVAAALESLR